MKVLVRRWLVKALVSEGVSWASVFQGVRR